MTKIKCVKLIAPDKSGILCYQGNCKVKIDFMSKMLKIEPKNEKFLDISVMLKWKFIQKKNLLFLFADNKNQDFVLSFANDAICQKVYDKIFKNREEDSVEKEELYQRFLIPMFQKCSKTSCSKRFIKVIFDWIEKHEEKEKKELVKLLKEQKRNHQILDIKNVKQESTTVNALKRRYSEMKKNKCGGNKEEESVVLIDRNKNVGICEDIAGKEVGRKKKNVLPPDVRILDGSSFKIVNFKKENRLCRKLLIFTSSKRTQCYEFNFCPSKQIFIHKCQHQQQFKGLKAVLKIDENGNECIEFEDKKHVCSLLNYDPERYMEIKIVKKPNYEIMENCSPKSKKVLIILNPNDRNQCYEYFWEAAVNKFRCRGCHVKKKHISAEVVHENTVYEYIRLLHDDHICELRKYDFTKFNQIKKYVLSPNFEIQTKIRDDGRDRKYLIIFDENDRKLCYTYYNRQKAENFRCNRCEPKGKFVSAKLCRNSKGEEYVILSNDEHVCSPKKYSTQKVMKQKQINFEKRKANHPESQILRIPNYELQRNSKGIPDQKLIVFFREDKTMCYEYEYNGDKFNCMKCIGTAKLHIDSENGEKYIILSKNEHKCKPVKYEAETKIEFIIFNKYDKKKPTKLIIFTSETKEFCYEYSVYQNSYSFRCIACLSLKKIVSAKLLTNLNGKEYVQLLTTEHYCAAKKFVLEKFQPKFIPESGFKLYSNRNGKLNSKMIVFDSEKHGFCYEYHLDRNLFKCNQCKNKNKSVTAKLCEKENGEKYLELSHIEHICKSRKYDAKKLQ